MIRFFVLAVIFFTHFLSAEKTHFLLIRHGETNWNTEGRYSGWTDIPLNSNGKMQAEGLANHLKTAHTDLSAIYSSTLLRAYQTAEETSKVLKLPIVQQDQLREICWGDGEGLTSKEKDVLYGKAIQEVTQAYPNRKERWNYPLFPNAETYNALYQRIENQLIQIANAHPGEKVALFSHGRAIRTLISESVDSENCPYPDNCGIAHFIYDPDQERPLQFVKIESTQL